MVDHHSNKNVVIPGFDSGIHETSTFLEFRGV